MKHFTHSFTQTKLAGAITFALLGLPTTSPVYAQQSNETDVEVINVKGVRGALISAANNVIPMVWSMQLPHKT